MARSTHRRPRCHLTQRGSVVVTYSIPREGVTTQIMHPSTLPACAVIPAAQTFFGKQGLSYFSGIAAETAGAKGICMHLMMIPPGTLAKAHMHLDHETAIYVLRGEAVMWWGEALQERLIVRAGEFLYIPAGMPHLPANLSRTEPCVAVLARTDPSEQESVVLLPELEVVSRES